MDITDTKNNKFGQKMTTVCWNCDALPIFRALVLEVQGDAPQISMDP